MTADFRACRLALGWSLRDTARRLRYAAPASIVQIETGRQAPPPGALEWMRAASAYLREHPTPSRGPA